MIGVLEAKGASRGSAVLTMPLSGNPPWLWMRLSVPETKVMPVLMDWSWKSVAALGVLARILLVTVTMDAPETPRLKTLPPWSALLPDRVLL